jgi:hypothetical protein
MVAENPELETLDEPHQSPMFFSIVIRLDRIILLRTRSRIYANDSAEAIRQSANRLLGYEDRHRES